MEAGPAGVRPHYLKEELYARVRSEPEIFEFLQAGSLDGLWYWDLEHPEHEWMSPEFWEAFGVDPATKPHLASSWQDIIDPDDLAVATANFERHCADPEHPYDQVVRYRHADGSTVWVRCRGVALRDAAGRPVRMLGAHTNLTAEMEATSRLQALNDNLAQFVHVAAHDLLAPLNTIRGHLGFLEKHHGDGLSDTGRALVRFSVEAAERMSELLTALEPVARTTKPLEVERVELPGLLDVLRADLGNALGAKGCDIEAVEVADVWADPVLLRVVLQNLLANAVKFAGDADGARIRVRHSRNAGEDVIDVDDEGPGVPESERERVFGMFEQGEQAMGAGGTGMGLAVSRRVALLHGGALEVLSSPEGGARFRLRLPRHGA